MPTFTGHIFEIPVGKPRIAQRNEIGKRNKTERRVVLSANKNIMISCDRWANDLKKFKNV